MSANDAPAAPSDCLIVGGGPAGLTAAIYLARFHLRTTVIDAGQSRAGMIPLARNHAGFPEGIAGQDLLARMQQQASLYGARLVSDEVRMLTAAEGAGFVAQTDRGRFAARSVLLATGVVNRRPRLIDDRTHAQALAGGQLRYCPICDGFEVTDRRVVVIGTGQHGCKEALFLRGYTQDVTLAAPEEGHDLSTAQQARLAQAGIATVGPCSAITLSDGQIVLSLAGGDRRFDSLYPALGSDIRSELARQLGAAMSEQGCLTTDAHQRTSVDGLYAAGDVVLGLDQISHAMGEAGVAATTIRNDLDRQRPLFR